MNCCEADGGQPFLLSSQTGCFSGLALRQEQLFSTWGFLPTELLGADTVWVIYEKLLKPAAKGMTHKELKEHLANAFINDTETHCTVAMAFGLEEQLVLGACFILQLSENSTQWAPYEAVLLNAWSVYDGQVLSGVLTKVWLQRCVAFIQLLLH